MVVSDLPSVRCSPNAVGPTQAQRRAELRGHNLAVDRITEARCLGGLLGSDLKRDLRWRWAVMDTNQRNGER